MYHEPIYITTEKDAVHWRVEFQQVVETTYLKLPDTVEKWIVPIAAEKENTTQWIETENGNVPVIQHNDKSFYYYCVGGGREIVSSGLCYVGRPIPVQNEGNKKNWY